MKRQILPPSRASLLKAIRDEYSINGAKIKPFASGVANFNYRIDANGVAYVCRVYASRSRKQIQEEVHILTRLSDLGFPCPAPLQTKKKKPIITIDTRNAIVYPLLPGKTVTRVTSTVLKEVGHLQGILHALTKTRSFPVSKAKWEPRDILALATKWQKTARPENLLAELRRFRFPSNLPSGLTHQDIKPENVLVNRGHVSAIIDFDNAYEGAFLFDIATSIIWFCADGKTISSARLTHFLNGYEEHRALTKQERAALTDAIRWRLLRETLIWALIEEGTINPHGDAKTKRKARALRSHFFHLFQAA